MANRYGTEGDDVLDGTFVADNIAGYAGDDVLRGFAGDDTLWAAPTMMDGRRLGADTLYGLSGFDTASYEFASSGVIVRLDGGLCQNGFAQGDRLYSVDEGDRLRYIDQLFGLDGWPRPCWAATATTTCSAAPAPTCCEAELARTPVYMLPTAGSW